MGMQTSPSRMQSWQVKASYYSYPLQTSNTSPVATGMGEHPKVNRFNQTKQTSKQTNQRLSPQQLTVTTFPQHRKKKNLLNSIHLSEKSFNYFYSTTFMPFFILWLYFPTSISVSNGFRVGCSSSVSRFQAERIHGNQSDLLSTK